MYVAVTRAQERLILSGAVPYGQLARRGSPRRRADRLGGAGVRTGHRRAPDGRRAGGRRRRRAHVGRASGAGAGSSERPRHPGPGAPVSDTGAADRGRGGGRGRRARAGSAAAPTPPRPVDHVSYSALEQYDACGYRFYLERVLGLPESDPVSGPDSADGLDARLRGTIAHALLENLDFAAPAVPDVARRPRRSRGGAAPSPPKPRPRSCARSWRPSPAASCAARLAAASDVRREAPFAYPLRAGEEEGLLVNGVVDVIGQARATGADRRLQERPRRRRTTAAYVERHYGTQRLVYALAALRDGAAEVVVVHCLLERPGEPVAATFGRRTSPTWSGRLAGLRRRILRRGIRRHPPPNRELCAGCPGRGCAVLVAAELTMADPPPS